MVVHVIWIGYTTRYREGGALIRRAAETLAEAKRDAQHEVRIEVVESQEAFVTAMAQLQSESHRLHEFHFFGHSGFHGPMFGTRANMEQLSPQEWRDLDIPFAPQGEAFFHACRTARWFAPFFAITYGVPTSGYYWYTTFSRQAHRFKRVRGKQEPVHLIGCPGRTSHGLGGALLKRVGLLGEDLRRFDRDALSPASVSLAVSAQRDSILASCPAAQTWLNSHLKSTRSDSGSGSDRVLDVETHQCSSGIADASVDFAVCVLALRFLDWDLVMNEMRRVLVPGGRILVLDLVTAPPKARELLTTPWLDRPSLTPFDPEYADDEFRDYLSERFPGGTYETLALNTTTRLVAFDTGPLRPGLVAPLRFP